MNTILAQIVEEERKKEISFYLNYVKKGKWKGHRRGIEYVMTIDEDIFYIEKTQVRIRFMLMIHSQFLSVHYRQMLQVKEKCVFSMYSS